jgi:acetyltransferase
VRAIRPEDVAALDAMLAACAPQDVRLRFGAALRKLAPDLIAGLTQIDYDRQMALVAEDQAGAALGLGQLYIDPEGETAEFALIVRSDHHGRGVGSLLLQALLDYAQARGLSGVWGQADRDNPDMIALALALGFETRPHADPAEVRLVRVLSPKDQPG